MTIEIRNITKRFGDFVALDDINLEIPDGELWVHCESGFRAAMGASLLRRAGRDVVLVDDEFGRAADAGLALVRKGS